MLFTLMLSQTLGAAVDALYERGDLDLLFSSPLAPRKVLTVRFLAVAVSVFSIFGMVLTPDRRCRAPSGATRAGSPHWWCCSAVALAASGAGLLLAAGLFRLIGPRRTRTVGQVLAAVIGAAFFLIAQARNILGGAQTASVAAMVMQFVARSAVPSAPVLSWPLRALLGEPLPLLAAVAIGVGVFLHRQPAAGGPVRRRRRRGGGSGHRRRAPREVHRAGRGSRRAPSRRPSPRSCGCCARDPALIAQVLLRVLYLIPLGFILLRQAGQGHSFALPGSAGGAQPGRRPGRRQPGLDHRLRRGRAGPPELRADADPGHPRRRRSPQPSCRSRCCWFRS